MANLDMETRIESVISSGQILRTLCEDRNLQKYQTTILDWMALQIWSAI